MLQVHLLLLNTFAARFKTGYGTLRILMVDLAGTAPACRHRFKLFHTTIAASIAAYYLGGNSFTKKISDIWL